VRKKAALCLLRLLRKLPADAMVVTPDTFSPIINTLLEEANLGVQLGAATLLLGIGTRTGLGEPPGCWNCTAAVPVPGAGAGVGAAGRPVLQAARHFSCGCSICVHAQLPTAACSVLPATLTFPRPAAPCSRVRDLPVSYGASCDSQSLLPTAAGYETCQPKLLKILERLVFVKDITQDYTYYGIPSPWLQCKVLRLLQYFPPLESSAQEKQLHDIISAIVASESHARMHAHAPH
jgi:hypothetical protein